MNEEQKEKIGEVVDRLENLIAALSMPIPDSIHVECLRESLPEVKEQLQELLTPQDKE